MLYRQLSKLAVVGERSESPKANQSRLRRPTPYSIEHYRHEGVRASKDDTPPADSPRGRSQSSTWTPTRTRAPTPHSSATKLRRRKEEKTVQWNDPLQQESPEQKSVPVPAPSKKKSAMKRSQATQHEEEKSTQKEEDSLEYTSGAPSKLKSDDTAASHKVNPCTLRRDRRSSIPRPKRIITTSDKPTQIVIPERPLSPLMPPAVPAPLQLSHRQTRINAIPSSTSTPAITSKTAARDFSFDRKPDALTVSSRSVHQNRPSAIARNNLSLYESTSYLQTKPKRAGTTRTRPTSPNAERRPAGAEDGSDLKILSPATSCSPLTTRPEPTGSLLPNLSFTPFFHDVKTFWKEKGSRTSASDSDSDRSTFNKSITSKPGVTVDALPGCSSPSKPKALPSSASVSPSHSAKSFWSGLSTSISCGAIVSGSGPDPSTSTKPALSMPESHSSSSKDKDLLKTSMVSSLSKYTVNRDTRSGEKRGARSGSVSSTAARVTSRSLLPRCSSGVPYRKKESNVIVPGKRSGKTSFPQPREHSEDGSSNISSVSKSTASSSTSFHTAKSHLSDTSASNIDTNTPVSMTATSSSMETEYIPTVPSELWNEIMDFCRSDSSSVPPEGRYCDCDDCLWNDEKNVAGCSTVVRVGEREKCRARR